MVRQENRVDLAVNNTHKNQAQNQTVVGVLIAVKKQLACIMQVDLEPDIDTENAEII